MEKKALVELAQEEYDNGVSMLFLKSAHLKNIYYKPVIAKPLSGYYLFEIEKEDNRQTQDLAEEVAKREEEIQLRKGTDRLGNRNSFLMHIGKVTSENNKILAAVKFYNAQLPDDLEYLLNR